MEDLTVPTPPAAAAPALDATPIVDAVHTAAAATLDAIDEQASNSHAVIIALLCALALGLIVAAWYFRGSVRAMEGR